MTHRFAAAGLAALLLAGAAGAQKAAPKIDPTGTWSVDAAHSTIGFAVRHIGSGKVRGKFNEYTGTVTADPKNLAKSSVSFTIQAASVDTGLAARDGHLKSPDFFDVEKFPTITFQSTKIEKLGAGYKATGKFTLHGVTKIISFPFTATGPNKGMQGEARAAIEAQLKINRKDYGLSWNNLIEGTSVVGDIVEIDLEIEGVKK